MISRSVDGIDFSCCGTMEEKNYTGAIPDNQDGGIINAESFVECSDSETAMSFYSKARRRLLDVNHWQDLSGHSLAHFQLADAYGNDVSGIVQEGYFFKIDIPGPGTKTGDGFDWAKVEAIEEVTSLEVESLAIRVRPAPNPTSGEDSIAHFYSEESTSTFTVTREGNKITAAIYDRNTKPNTDHDGPLDQVRNVIGGIIGRFAFSKIQWKKLTNGLLEIE